MKSVSVSISGVLADEDADKVVAAAEAAHDAGAHVSISVSSDAPAAPKTEDVQAP